MADSNITKRALAAALKELMEQKPFSKINVAEICEKCGMNRKSFYYHFKDKYDLVNWIFDMDFQINFFADAFIGSLERWLSESDCMPASELIVRVKACIKSCAEIAEISENAEKNIS